MISFDIVWIDYEDKDVMHATVGNYRLQVGYEFPNDCWFYLDHLYPYAGGEGLEPIASQHFIKGAETAKQMAERALLIELLRSERNS